MPRRVRFFTSCLSKVAYPLVLARTVEHCDFFRAFADILQYWMPEPYLASANHLGSDDGLPNKFLASLIAVTWQTRPAHPKMAVLCDDQPSFDKSSNSLARSLIVQVDNICLQVRFQDAHLTVPQAYAALCLQLLEQHPPLISGSATRIPT